MVFLIFKIIKKWQKLVNIENKVSNMYFLIKN